MTTLVCDCRLFSDINVPRCSVPTHMRCGGIFNKCFSANLLKNLTVKKNENRLKISRVTAMNLVSHFLADGVPCIRPVWARERRRISPPRFLAECCKRQLNQGSFVLLYFRLFTFLICIEFVYLYFPVLFCLSVLVK